MAIITKEIRLKQKKQRQANDLYLHGRHSAALGSVFLKKGLHEKRIADFRPACKSLREALKHYHDANDLYNLALCLLPSQKLCKRVQRKKEGLKKCDVACAKRAIKHMAFKPEQPKDSAKQ